MYRFNVTPVVSHTSSRTGALSAFNTDVVAVEIRGGFGATNAFETLDNDTINTVVKQNFMVGYNYIVLNCV
jgi:hypothetical protein